ncbi:MAG TPA: MFS transporter [Terriglobales bacterium]|nr:MFS transporter [Terriglobales bacterium]
MSSGRHTATQFPVSSRTAWFNQNVVGMGITSLLSDIGHEMITTLLPSFLTVIGLSAAVLGTVEGVADSVSSFVKLGAGWLSDRFGHRKSMAVGGYLLTGTSNGLFSLAHGWPLILAGRTIGWFGRGFRTPLRNTMLAASVPQAAVGRAFGFERAGDTLGAIVGPLLAVGLLTHMHSRAADPSSPFRHIFSLALIPGVASGLVFAILVRDKPLPSSGLRFWATVKGMPRSYRRFLFGVGIFGAGDYARTFLILAATQLLTPSCGVTHAAQIAGLLYVGHNVFYAAYSYPIGALSDRVGRQGLLALGYAVGALASLGLAAAFLWKLDVLIYLLAMFGLAGFSIAVTDALEGAMTADLVREPVRGTAYGVLGAVNGVGDLVASVLLGILWTALSPVVAFAYAAVLMGSGALIILRVPLQLASVEGRS